MRDTGDIPTGRRNDLDHEVTVCGAYARRASFRRAGSGDWQPRHVEFVPDLSWSCRACARLLGCEPYDPTTDRFRPIPPPPDIHGHLLEGAPHAHHTD